MINWMIDRSQPVDEVRHRIERVYGTMLVMQRALQKGWELYWIWKDEYAYGTWYGAVLRLKPTQDSGDFRVVALSGGDHCLDCGLKIGEITAWVGKALEILEKKENLLLQPYDPYGRPRPYTHFGMVAFAFTKPGAQGIDEILLSLNTLYGQSSRPIIISWVDENGQIWWRCIGNQGACEAARRTGWAQATVCAQQGQSTSCEAQECESYPDECSQSREETSGGTPGPPPQETAPLPNSSPGIQPVQAGPVIPSYCPGNGVCLMTACL